MPSNKLQATGELMRPRYERFAREYVRNGGIASHAARAATASTNTHSHRVIGTRLLKRPDVQALIRELMDEEANPQLTS